MNLFEQASRAKLRFQYKGLVSVEDLWDLPVQSLDSIYKDLSTRAKAESVESLLGATTRENTELSLQIEVVKRIVEVKLTEAEAAKVARQKAIQKQKILEAIAMKKDAKIQEMSVEELERALAAL